MNPESLKLKNEECLGRETGERFLATPDLVKQRAAEDVGPYIGRRIDVTSSVIRLAGDRRMPPSPRGEGIAAR